MPGMCEQIPFAQGIWGGFANAAVNGVTVTIHNNYRKYRNIKVENYQKKLYNKYYFSVKLQVRVGEKKMDLFEELKENGVDIDEGMERMMGNAGLYQRMLFKLPDMMKKLWVDPEFDGSEYSEIIERVHTMKGTTGNLSITPLFKSYTEMLGLLREGKPEEARAVYREILPLQDKIIACIEKYM